VKKCQWIVDQFKTEKPIIAMCHFDALPGDPRYDAVRGLPWIIDRAHANLAALQDGGVDAIMFSNEFSLPYLKKVDPITTTCMARIIAELFPEIRVPYGVNVLWDPQATIELSVAVDASFVREVFSGVYASDFGLWDTDCGATARVRHSLGGDGVRLFFNIYPEAAVYLAGRDIADVARTTVFNHRPDALCVSGKTAGAETSPEILKRVVDAVPDVAVFANTGVAPGNVREQLAIADGAVVGTAFKKNGDFFELVDKDKVARFMDAVAAARRT
jgi:uncharacterized protein